jgi:hypothetical protein
MPILIEGHEFTLFADRDRQNLARLSFGGRVEWFEHRFNRMLIAPLERIRPTNRGRAEDDLWSLLVFATVLFNGVEALGSFATVLKASNFERFDVFVTGFMNKDYSAHGPALWKFRNGLTHGLTVEHGAFEFFEGPAIKLEQGTVKLDPDSLLRDFRTAFGAYLDQLRLAPHGTPLRTNFEGRFEDRYQVPPCRP